ncbi:MAG: hypothetical protein WCZ23_08170 [Rhodospirillaceae bacterium]
MHYTWKIMVAATLLLGGIATAAKAQKDETALDAMETASVVLDYRTCLELAEVTGGRAVVLADGGTYTSGVDARGRPVVPAEGPNGGADWSSLTETLQIDVSVDIVERYGVNVPPGSSLPLGTIEVREGRAWFNDQPLVGHDREALWQACRQLGIFQGKAGQRKGGQP